MSDVIFLHYLIGLSNRWTKDINFLGHSTCSFAVMVFFCGIKLKGTEMWGHTLQQRKEKVQLLIY